MPDVGVHLTADVLELVQIPDGNSAIGDRDTSDFAKRVRMQEAELVGSVAENEALLISSQAPALASVSKGPTHGKSCQVVHEGDVGLPGQLHELTVPFREAF